MNENNQWFTISLAQWSLNKMLFAKQITNLEFPGFTKREFGIDVVELVNQFFMDKANDTSYLNELKQQCDDNGVLAHLIMVDSEGSLASLVTSERIMAVQRHYKWIDTASYLGCSSIRVNAFGNGTRDEVKKAAIESVSRLADYAAKQSINILLENHGGYSSDGEWLVSLLKAINLPNVGSLPDFGNFCIRSEKGYEWGTTCLEEYDRYKGVAELMPFAKGVSAKAMAFDENDECVETNYGKMMKIIKEAHFTGYIGIESSVKLMENEMEGVRKTKALLEKYA